MKILGLVAFGLMVWLASPAGAFETVDVGALASVRGTTPEKDACCVHIATACPCQEQGCKAVTAGGLTKCVAYLNLWGYYHCNVQNGFNGETCWDPANPVMWKCQGWFQNLAPEGWDTCYAEFGHCHAYLGDECPDPKCDDSDNCPPS